jgi:hypothetical protein
MTAVEQIAQLETGNATLRPDLVTTQKHLAPVTERRRELEQRMSKDSCNISKSPSSDGLNRHLRSQWVWSVRKSRGRPSHRRQSLAQVTVPDVEVRHRPAVCDACHCLLNGKAGQLVEWWKGPGYIPASIGSDRTSCRLGSQSSYQLCAVTSRFYRVRPSISRN